ncbi:MAG: nitroreductase family protein [Anaerolineae bacterium]|jgi:nitroreductase|nr:nitroreductase family protein [Anaerolineae bacterium]MDH7474800.1 nitroreductase family protein [Anaerolineae bacterium]
MINQSALDNIFARRSIRRYTDQPVSENDIKTLLEAAMAAPSASDRRPWHFIVVRERTTLDALAESHPYAKMLFEAPLCIVPCADPAISDAWWIQDCCAATENLLLAATALGLGTVWIGVYPRPERVQAVRQILGIPESIVPLCLIPVGHPAEHKQPRTRYDAARVHQGKW